MKWNYFEKKVLKHNNNQCTKNYNWKCSSERHFGAFSKNLYFIYLPLMSVIFNQFFGYTMLLLVAMIMMKRLMLMFTMMTVLMIMMTTVTTFMLVTFMCPFVIIAHRFCLHCICFIIYITIVFVLWLLLFAILICYHFFPLWNERFGCHSHFTIIFAQKIYRSTNASRL